MSSYLFCVLRSSNTIAHTFPSYHWNLAHFVALSYLLSTISWFDSARGLSVDTTVILGRPRPNPRPETAGMTVILGRPRPRPNPTTMTLGRPRPHLRPAPKIAGKLARHASVTVAKSMTDASPLWRAR